MSTPYERNEKMAARAPEELHALVEAAFNAGDADRLVDLYDEDATLIVPPQGARATGKQAIREAIEATLALQPRARMEVLEKLETEGLALTQGRWTLAGTGEDGASVEMSGRGTMVSRCQADGSWRIVLDDPMSFDRDPGRMGRTGPMSELQVIVDRVEIEALRAEFSDAAMMRDYDRFASLFTRDGVWRMPYANVEFAGREEIRAGIERAQEAVWEFFVQTTHPGTIELEGDSAVGRAYVSEFGQMRDGRSQRHSSLYHDRYRRTPDGWRFAERVYEIRYLDTSPLTGSAPATGGIA